MVGGRGSLWVERGREGVPRRARGWICARCWSGGVWGGFGGWRLEGYAFDLKLLFLLMSNLLLCLKPLLEKR